MIFQYKPHICRVHIRNLPLDRWVRIAPITTPESYNVNYIITHVLRASGNRYGDTREQIHFSWETTPHNSPYLYSRNQPFKYMDGFGDRIEYLLNEKGWPEYVTVLEQY